MFSEHYNPMLRLDTETLYNLELLDICKDGAYMGMWQILAAANILQHPICSVYPDLRRIVRPDLNRRVYCYNEALNTKRLLHIMWTPMSVNSQDPCHFVPLLRVVRRIQIVMKIYEFMNFTNFTNVFHFYICRAVKLPAIEKKLAQQKENQVKRAMMSRQLELEQLMKVEEHENQVGHLLLLPVTASQHQSFK